MRQTINPFRLSVGMIIDRLKWDLKLKSWKHRQKICKEKNKYRDKKALIICNGPSLNQVDFNELMYYGIYSFGLNKINLLFDRTDFRPNCIVAVNPYVLEQNAEFYNTTNTTLFADRIGDKWIKDRENITFFHSNFYFKLFAKDCTFSINQGATVTYVAMQLAYHMGFTYVGLIGCDHSFKTKGPSNKLVASINYDIDHFDSKYFSSGDLWQLPDLPVSEIHYKIAKKIFNSSDRQIFNCTVGGKLDIFNRLSIQEFSKL